MCTITMTQLKENLGYYTELSRKEEVRITKNGKYLTTLGVQKSDSFEDFVTSITGILKEEDLDLNDPKTAGIFKKL